MSVIQSPLYKNCTYYASILLIAFITLFSKKTAGKVPIEVCFISKHGWFLFHPHLDDYKGLNNHPELDDYYSFLYIIKKSSKFGCFSSSKIEMFLVTRYWNGFVAIQIWMFRVFHNWNGFIVIQNWMFHGHQPRLLNRIKAGLGTDPGY